jgi:hypothetical protein
LRTLFISGQLLTLAALCGLAPAQNGAHYHSGKLLQMESVQCVVESQASAGAQSKPCQEYVLQGEGVLFHLHTKSGGQQALLPVGKNLPYRLEEGHFYLRLNGHDREFSVVAMEPVEPQQAPVHSAEKINHLQ